MVREGVELEGRRRVVGGDCAGVFVLLLEATGDAEGRGLLCGGKSPEVFCGGSSVEG